jgi:hypothetical protein
MSDLARTFSEKSWAPPDGSGWNDDEIELGVSKMRSIIKFKERPVSAPVSIHFLF